MNEKIEKIREAINNGKIFYVDTFIGKKIVSGISERGDFVIAGHRSWAISNMEIDYWYGQIKFDEEIQNFDKEEK